MHALRTTTAFDGSRFLEGGATVVIDGTTIVGVESFTHELAADIPVTTYEGTMLPGLFDCHVHLVADGSPGSLERAGDMDDDQIDAVIGTTLAQQAAAGVTTVRDLGDRRYRALAVRDRSVPGLPRIVAAGPPLTIPAGHCHYLGGEVDGPAAIRAAVAERVSRGVDVVKVMATGGMLTPGTDVLGVQFEAADLALIVQLAHDAGLKVLAHAHSLAGSWAAVNAGVDGIEHFTCLTQGGPEFPDDLLASIARAGIIVGPTYGFDQAVLDRMPSPPPQIQALLQRLGLTREEVLDRRAENAVHLRAHGITVVTGLDAGAAPPKRHGQVWRAVNELVVRGGYPVAEALATASSVAADACGLAEVTGRLAPGLDADLLVVDGDLRSEPAALGRPVAVLLRGSVPASVGP